MEKSSPVMASKEEFAPLVKSKPPLLLKGFPTMIISCLSLGRNTNGGRSQQPFAILLGAVRLRKIGVYSLVHGVN